MFHVKHCRLCWNLCTHNKTILYYVPLETSLSCDRSSAQSIELFRERRSLTSARHKRGSFRYLTLRQSRSILFHVIHLSILVQEHGYTRINTGLTMPHPIISLQWYLPYFRESISLNLKWEPAQPSLPSGWQLQFQGSVTCSAQTYYSPYHSDISDESNYSSVLL